MSTDTDLDMEFWYQDLRIRMRIRSIDSEDNDVQSDIINYSELIEYISEKRFPTDEDQQKY